MNAQEARRKATSVEEAKKTLGLALNKRAK